MKKFALFIATLFACTISANTIHWITFIDTTDPRVGECDTYSREFLYSRWISQVNAAIAPLGYSSEIHDFYGSGTTPRNCKDIIESIECESENDIIIFYYIGHGARAINDKTRYPQMCMAQDDPDYFVPVSWVHNQLKSKSARLVLTISMCCNSYDGSLTPKDNINFGFNKGNVSFGNDEIEAIKHLILGYKGDILMSSSSAGQASWAMFIPPLQRYMDIFTFTFIYDFTAYCNSTTTPEWKRLLAAITADVNNITLAGPSMGQRVMQQTPIYDINVTKVEYPQIKVKEAPTPQPEPQGEEEPTTTPANKEENIVTNQGDQLCQDLTTVLDQIINTNVEFKKRIAMKNALLDFFTPNAMVKVWGGDTKIVIDKYPISDYLGIISTSKKFYKIVAMQTDCDSDAKIQTLYVREYIKKD